MHYLEISRRVRHGWIKKSLVHVVTQVVVLLYVLLGVGQGVCPRQVNEVQHKVRHASDQRPSVVERPSFAVRHQNRKQTVNECATCEGAVRHNG
jgi:hypothetical protein